MSSCVRDPGTGLTADTWLEYIRRQSGQWVDIIEGYLGRKVTGFLERYLQLLELHNTAQLCLIHRDIRQENIGARENSLILFDFELAIWGDPLWDVGRYLLSCQSLSDFVSGYGIPDNEVLTAYTGLFAFSFAEYLIRNGQTDGTDFHNCVQAITKIGSM